MSNTKSGRGEKPPRVRLKNWDEYDLLEDFRAGKTQYLPSSSAFIEECHKQGINPDHVSNYWHKGKHFSIHVKGGQFDFEKATEALAEKLSSSAINYKPPKYPNITSPHCLVIDPADIHIGKLALAVETNDEYNCEIAVKRVQEGVAGVLRKAGGYPLDRIALIVGNDILHIDNPKRTTTSGTPQDTDGMWHSAFKIAVELYVGLIEQLRLVAPVDVIFNPSNHDFQSGWMLAQVIDAWFRLDDAVTVDASINHRKYYRYGNSLIGTTHGDGAKTEDLHNLMAIESGQDWVDCLHKYWYLHHIHHKKGMKYVTVQDKPGVTLEYLRSPSGSDSWHHRNGYVGSPKAVEGFIHCRENGQVARITHYFTKPKQ